MSKPASHRARLVAFVLAALPALLRADPVLSPLFADNAVLQRDVAVPVWGTAARGEKITVAFAGQTRSTVAGAGGDWEVSLAPLPARTGGTLVVTGRSTLTRTNLIVGDVWLCAGQSNMGLRVSEAAQAAAEIAAASEPDIRQLCVPQNPAPEPQPDTAIHAGWQPASPQTAGDFSAVGFFFAREIHASLGVPVGLIHSSAGGTPIHSWLSLAALETLPGFRRAFGHFNARPGSPAVAAFLPARLYNGMIHPLLRYRLKGVLWYQGEGNAGGNPGEYVLQQSRLIESWRADWGGTAFPFYFVQLPNWSNPDDASQKQWAYFREGQAACLKLANTGMAVTLDVGEPGSLHPKNKQAVGHRLALIALAETYRQPVTASGPVMVACVVQNQSLRVRFAHALGLQTRDRQPPAGFEIAGADGNFSPALAEIEGDTVVVTSPQVARPAWLRYAWADNPTVNLCNAAGLPAAPFRLDQPAR